MNKLGSLLVVVGVVATLVERADACGGCFSPPDTDTTVEQHRMVVALSTMRTTLWDQIRYTGAPEDFVWVLPVPSPDTEIAVADPVFFDDLEFRTSPMLSPPPLDWPDCEPPPTCPGDDNGGGYGAQDASAASSDAGVQVFHEETVGPYEVVTIGSDDPAALQSWLVAHGYNVPEATIPTIAHYVALGNVFVVLRLAPEVGVSAMQPIRVRYPGYMGSFPLKMVTVGASGVLGLTLWVIADQRFESRNYATQLLDQSQLVWDFADGSHNYAEVFDAQIDAAGGRAWIDEHTTWLDDLWIDSKEVEIARANLTSPTVTRLRTRMLTDHLQEDLELQPAADPAHVSNFIQVQQAINVPDLTCPVYPPRDCGSGWRWDVDGCSASPAGVGGGVGGAAAATLLAAGFGGIVLAARRRRHRRGQ